MRLPLVSICLSARDREEMRAVGTHGCSPSVGLIHHKSCKALGCDQGYLVSPRGARLYPVITGFCHREGGLGISHWKDSLRGKQNTYMLQIAK